MRDALRLMARVLRFSSGLVQRSWFWPISFSVPSICTRELRSLGRPLLPNQLLLLSTPLKVLHSYTTRRGSSPMSCPTLNSIVTTPKDRG